MTGHTSKVGRTAWWVVAGAIALAGVVTVVALAGTFGMSDHDTAVLIAWSSGTAAATCLLAAVILYAARAARTTVQIVMVALTPVLAVALGVVEAARAMFLSHHDLRVLAITLVGAGTIAATSGMLLGRRVATASRSVTVLARQLGDADGIPAGTLHGAPVELAALARELEATSQRLAAARAETEALERGRRNLVAWVSHDLRTPLSAMRAMVEAIEDGVVDDERSIARYHHTLLAEIERLSEMVDDLFVLATIDAGAVDLRPEPVSIDELVSEALDGVKAKAASRGVLLDAASDGPLIVEVSAAEMARVVHNLLDNAIRHTPAGSCVRVETGVVPGGGRARLAVVDGCGGIAPDELRQVFDLAYRGDAARSSDSGGGGLGLKVARGLVEAHDGALSVDNVTGGCRFVVDLPLPTPAQGEG